MMISYSSFIISNMMRDDMPFRDLVTNWLDPVFVREEELAAVIGRRSEGLAPERRAITRQIVGTGVLEIEIPASYEWFVYSIVSTEPADAGAGSLPKENFITVLDDQELPMFYLGMQQLPAVTAQSYITWGIDLTNMREDDGGVPPSYKITAPFPKLWLKEGYMIRINRDGVGGAPITTATWRVFYLEYRKVS